MEIKGIDVSSWQGKIDWNKVANYGMDFAILRITEAGNVIDGQFENNFAGCNKYKIPVDLLEKGLILVYLPILLEVSLPQNHQLAQNHQRPHRKEPVICLSQN